MDGGRSDGERGRAERLRRENEQLRRENAEQVKQIAEAEKQIADLERQLALRQQNSTTSSKPPSSDGLAGRQRERGRRKKSRRKPGAQVGHPGHCRPLVPLARVNHVMEVFPDASRHCQHALPAQSPEARSSPGFAWFRCAACGTDRLVPFSCKGRGFCPSCERRVARRLQRRGLANGDEGSDGPDAWAEEAPVLAGIAGASVQGVVALGSRAGARPRRCGDPPEEVELPARGRHHAHQHGFDLHAGIVAPAGNRERLERLCRYALRPPVAQDRVSLTGEGHVLLRLRHRWTDGTTHLLFEPTELLERLAAVTPRPRINLILYHGVLAPRAAWRARVVDRSTSAGLGDARAPEVDLESADGHGAQPRRVSNLLWADLMRRSFGFDVLACPTCGGRMHLVALIEETAVIQRILRHLGLPTEIPEPRPARAPPPRDPGHLWEDAEVTFDPCS